MPFVQVPTDVDARNPAASGLLPGRSPAIAAVVALGLTRSLCRAERQTRLNREDDDVILLAQLSDEGRQHVEARLRSNLMIWLTTVSPSGRPDSVPVWFLLRDDETLLVYSQPGKPKLRNIRANPNVAFGLDVTDIGRDVWCPRRRSPCAAFGRSA